MKFASLRQFLQAVAVTKPFRESLVRFEVVESIFFQGPLFEEVITVGDFSPEATRGSGPLGGGLW